MISDINTASILNELLDETKRTSHGLWKKEDFKEWGKRALKLIEELSGISSTFYTTFLRVHHEAMLMATDDERFPTHVALCVSILKSAFLESSNETGK